MTPRSETEFWVDSPGEPITFIRDDSGRISALELGGRRAMRVDESVGAAAPLAEYIGEFESAELDTSYRVALKNGNLELQHRRHGTIPLTHLHRDEFGSPK